MESVLQRAQAINARTQGWLGQFSRRTVGPQEAAQIQQVLHDTEKHMHGLLAETEDAHAEHYLQNTLRDLAKARGIYHGMVQTHQAHQKQRVNYGFQAMAAANQQMVQTSMAIAQRMARALALTLGGGMTGMAMPMMLPTTMAPPPTRTGAVPMPPLRGRTKTTPLCAVQPSAFETTPPARPARPALSAGAQAWIAYRVTSSTTNVPGT